MKLFIAASVIAVAASTASAENEFCGQWNTTQTDDYILYNNLWGQFGDPNGTQCTGLDSVDDSTIAWHTTFSWIRPRAAGPEVTSIPSTIEYEVDYEDQLVANVAYDLFTTSVLDTNAEYEIMVWLAVLGGAGPISSTGKPIAHTTVGGVDFDMYYGMNGNMTVFSYINTANLTNSFSADLKQFFDEIPANYSIDPSQYLINVQAGTEPFSGTGTLTVSKYSAAVHIA